jgi:hypothetical protein
MYPPSSMAWKKTMQAFHTAGDPPSSGRSILPTRGWTQKRRLALRKSVREKRRATAEGAYRDRALRASATRREPPERYSFFTTQSLTLPITSEVSLTSMV